MWLSKDLSKRRQQHNWAARDEPEQPHTLLWPVSVQEHQPGPGSTGGVWIKCSESQDCNSLNHCKMPCAHFAWHYHLPPNPSTAAESSAMTQAQSILWEIRIINLRFLILLLLRQFQREHSSKWPSTERSEGFISPVCRPEQGLCHTPKHPFYSLQTFSILPLLLKCRASHPTENTWGVCCSSLGELWIHCPSLIKH